jgi:hypothetical protein
MLSQAHLAVLGDMSRTEGKNNHVNYIAARNALYSFSGKPVSFLCPRLVRQEKYSFNICVMTGNAREKFCYFKQLEWQSAFQLF